MLWEGPDVGPGGCSHHIPSRLASLVPWWTCEVAVAEARWRSSGINGEYKECVEHDQSPSEALQVFYSSSTHSFDHVGRWILRLVVS